MKINVDLICQSLLVLQDDRSTPLHFASAQGNLDMLQLMYSLQHDNFVAALFLPDAMSMTPLHRAALFNHKAVVVFLLDKVLC